MSLGQPEQTKNPKTNTQKADCKLSKIYNKTKKKKEKKEKTCLEILVFFRGREDKSFGKGNTTKPIFSLSIRIRKHW